jgi:predicted DsbA family dithiol-disulfide isomerase
MNSRVAKVHFDYVDPLSWLLAREIVAAGVDDTSFQWVPRELRPPPIPLTTIDDPDLAPRWSDARKLGAESHIVFAPPALVPWTRKAHELTLHAHQYGSDADVREAIFEAYLFDGKDIGRVDVLVDVARSAGLDITEAKAVLDVDRYEIDVARAFTDAIDADIHTVPTITLDGKRLEGFHNGAAIRTFLGT